MSVNLEVLDPESGEAIARPYAGSSWTLEKEKRTQPGLPPKWAP